MASRNAELSLDAALAALGVPSDPSEGILVIRFTRQGPVIPHILRVGLMSEGRLNDAIMPIFQELMRARVREGERLRKEKADATIG